MDATNFINNCLNKQAVLDVADKTTIDFFSEVYPTMMSILNKAYSLDEFGSSKADKFWDSANDLTYLHVYLQIVQLSVQQDILSGNCDAGSYENINSKYKIDCIKKYFSCISVDIDPYLNIFGLGLAGMDGIDYMALETGDCKIFEIQ